MTTNRELELQSDRIEQVLASHKAPARVTGGVVTPRVIQFRLAPALDTKVAKIQALTDELALALGASSVRISRQGSDVQLEIPCKDAQPVKLLPLMAKLASAERRIKGEGSLRLPPGTAVLGMCDDGAPLLLRLPSPDVAHVLISGTTGSGKTALCQTMILSLAMTHRRSQLQLILTSGLSALASLPHRMDARTLPELAALLERAPEPRIAIVIDELADAIRTDDDCRALAEILQRGHKSGIHIIAATRNPPVLSPKLLADFPIRIVGKVATPEDAHAATGIGGTGAEKLEGHGDFIAVATGQVLRFQAAYVSPAEMQQVVAQLNSAPLRWDIIQQRPTMLRQAVGLLN